MPLTGGPGSTGVWNIRGSMPAAPPASEIRDERLTATAAPGLIAQPGYRTELAGGLLHSTC